MNVKKLMCFILFLLLIAGCGKNFVVYKGETNQWKGEYRLNKVREGENSIFNFYYIGKQKVLKNVSININEGETFKTYKSYNVSEEGKKISITSICSNCNTDRGKEIKVEINWDNNIEEFYLKNK
ncbi:hypothetical protein B4102_2172 [Heyndrickxia sporothermodurans]|uniref:Lipoprotein n=1 Tax=Heyndrickxia sporothermodurans TaxID=46224 RepID=A0A150LGS7_9BACI|nr:hypothetical protein [Heyndrickxia sporothermodurans]KYD11444.1 hypothetical protein B4102_2172 [Heyndrickxia sporothermodurans]